MALAVLLLLALIPVKITYTAVEDTQIQELEASQEAPEAHRWGVSQENDRYLINGLISQYAREFGVSADVMHRVIKCESTYNTFALGDAGYSRGLVQIHSRYWPEITDDMAYDPEFAISFLAEKLSEGKGRLWTCWRKFN
jgi:hypothetical protein